MCKDSNIIDVVVVVAGANHLIGPWIDSYRMSGNVIPVEFYADAGEWDKETMVKAAALGTIIDATDIYAGIRDRQPLKQRKVGWKAKPAILAAVDHEWAIWLDHDLEVRGRLEPMLEHMLDCPGAWFGSPRYATFTKKYSGKRVAQHGIVIAKPRCDKMKRWATYTLLSNESNDEVTFWNAFSPWPEGEVIDLYRRGWYDSPDVGWGINQKGLKPQKELIESGAALVHWPGGTKLGFFESIKLRSNISTVQEDAPVVVTGSSSSGRTGIDAVLVLGTESKWFSNSEAMYAIRSLEENLLDLRDIWIVGHKPIWATGVKHIPMDDPAKHSKDANIIRKLLEVCKEDGLSDNFLFCSDDQMLIKPVHFKDIKPTWLREFREDDAQWYDRTKWHRRLRETLRKFGNGSKYFQPHKFMPYNKHAFVDAMSKYDWEHDNACIINSLYYNAIGEVGVEESGDHKFVSGAQSECGMNSATSKATHLAYTDSTLCPAFSNWVMERFPEPSRFEIDEEEHEQSSPVNKKDIKFMRDGRVMIHGRECLSCSQKRQARLDELKANRKDRERL